LVLSSFDSLFLTYHIVTNTKCSSFKRSNSTHKTHVTGSFSPLNPGVVQIIQWVTLSLGNTKD